MEIAIGILLVLMVAFIGLYSVEHQQHSDTQQRLNIRDGDLTMMHKAYEELDKELDIVKAKLSRKRKPKPDTMGFCGDHPEYPKEDNES